MELDPVFLSRLQFAWLIAFHILMPALTVGLASFIAVLEGLHFFTRREIYLRISTFWIKIFSVAFGIGVVSGVIMPFQFGTNWSRYSDATANVLAPLFAYEGLTAFFLEAAFLGVLLFGRKLVPPGAHFVAALMVAFGTLLSSFWILAANSWMQTPAGYEIVDGRFFPTDWFQVIFNPSFPLRLAHTVVGFYITTGCAVVAVSAYLLVRRKSVAEAKTALSITLWLLSGLVPLQIFIGDQHGLNTLEHQPAKLAAIEAHWETGSRVPLILFAIPDDQVTGKLSRLERGQGCRRCAAAADQDNPLPLRQLLGERGGETAHVGIAPDQPLLAANDRVDCADAAILGTVDERERILLVGDGDVAAAPVRIDAPRREIVCQAFGRHAAGAIICRQAEPGQPEAMDRRRAAMADRIADDFGIGCSGHRSISPRWRR